MMCLPRATLLTMDSFIWTANIARGQTDNMLLRAPNSELSPACWFMRRPASPCTTYNSVTSDFAHLFKFRVWGTYLLVSEKSCNFFHICSIIQTPPGEKRYHMIQERENMECSKLSIAQKPARWKNPLPDRPCLMQVLSNGVPDYGEIWDVHRSRAGIKFKYMLYFRVVIIHYFLDKRRHKGQIFTTEWQPSYDLTYV